MNMSIMLGETGCLIRYVMTPEYERLEGVQGPERLLVGKPRSGSQPAGAEARSEEDAGVGKTVEQSRCQYVGSYGIRCGEKENHDGPHYLPFKELAPGQRSGLPNAGGMARELAAQDSDNSNDING